MSTQEAPQAQAPARVRGQRKTRIGVVTSNRMQKTIVVRVTTLARHALYHRVIKHANSFKAHDERNEARIGDVVKIMETRPLSKDKRWRLIEIVKKASTAPALPDVESEQAARREAADAEPGAPQA